MSGFRADWLMLREPADRAARSQRLIAMAGRDLAAFAAPEVCDLGAGTGAGMRAFAPHFPASTRWTLVDNAPALLAQIRAPGVTRRVGDLAANPALWPATCRLVTATALFDLAAAGWLDRLAAALSAARLPLLSCLTYDGHIGLVPQHPFDVAMIAAFNDHQKTDKGLGGPAAGPDAHRRLVALLAAHGYRVEEAETPWRLDGVRDAELIRAVLEGWAEAAVGRCGVTAGKAAAWLAARLGATDQLVIGHRDLYARPSGT
ncbi:MAG: class I SAM-dependent methyltransferase [Rhodobacteraceae bacterium]|nr:class I SAM-dependent methyltransferase [Paracoccaceae bacterium]